MYDFTIKVGNFKSTTSEIIANTEEARRFLAIGPAGISINVRASAVSEYMLRFADEGLSFDDVRRSRPRRPAARHRLGFHARPAWNHSAGRPPREGRTMFNLKTNDSIIINAIEQHAIECSAHGTPEMIVEAERDLDIIASADFDRGELKFEQWQYIARRFVSMSEGAFSISNAVALAEDHADRFERRALRRESA